MKQPRVPEYREADGTAKYLRTLSLFLKDFSLETWKNVQNLLKEVGVEPEPDEDGMYAFHINEDGHLICTYDSTRPPPLSINENGHLIYTVSSGKWIDLGRVVGEGSGSFDTDETLMWKNGRLCVNTAEDVEADNTLPITSAAVHTTVGNIEAILKTI